MAAMAVPSGAMLTSDFKEQYQHHAAALAEERGVSVEELRGTEKRQLEKQIRMARMTARILREYRRVQERRRAKELAMHHAGLDGQTPLFGPEAMNRMVYASIRCMASGVPEKHLIKWAVDACRRLGFDDRLLAQFSLEFLVVQAVDSTAYQIQRAWREYWKRKCVKEADCEPMLVHILDDSQFEWTPGQNPVKVEVEEPSTPEPPSPVALKVSEQPIRSRSGNYMDDTQATVHRNMASSTRKTSPRKKILGDVQDVGRSESYQIKAKVTMLRLGSGE